MKKITLDAHQLTDATMKKVSLVRNGANREPFRIIKAEALPADGSLDTLAAKVQKMFGKPEGPTTAVAVYVQKDAAPAMFPLLKEAGFRVEQEHAEMMGDVIVLKQEGYVADADGSMLTLSEAVGVQLSTVIKDFCSWHVGTDFNANLQNLGFYPGVRMAVDALHETVYAIMSNASTPSEATEPLEAALKAFSKHVAGLARVLPEAVFKMEQKLASEFGTPTVASTDSISKSESTTMKPNLREAVAGDLAGLFDEVTKADDATAAAAAEAGADAAVAAAAAEAAAAEATTAADAAATAAAQAAADAGAAEGAAAAAATAAAGDEEEVKKSDSADLATAMREAIGMLATQMKTQFDALGGRIAVIEKTAEDAKATAAVAVQKADNTVLVTDAFNLEGTLHSASSLQRVTKADAPSNGESNDVWAGLFPALDAIVEARGK